MATSMRKAREAEIGPPSLNTHLVFTQGHTLPEQKTQHSFHLANAGEYIVGFGLVVNGLKHVVDVFVWFDSVVNDLNVGVNVFVWFEPVMNDLNVGVNVFV